MMVYKKKSAQPFKWILALILFFLALAITFDDLEGMNLGDSYDKNAPVEANPGIESTTDEPDSCLPAGLPEAGALLLVAGGLGVMYLIRLRK